MNLSMVGTIYAMLHVAHGIADYWVQTDKQAQLKGTDPKYLWDHVLTYTLTMSLVPIALIAMGQISISKMVLFPLVIALPHAWMDSRKFITWFVKKTKGWNKGDNLAPHIASIRAFVTIEMDQKFHYLCLLLTAFWLSS